MSSSSILSVLTEDLLMKVNEKLSDGSDRKTWRLVCRDFLWVDFLTRKHLRVLRVEFLFTLLRNYTAVQTLDLSVCPRIDDGTVAQLLSRRGTTEWTQNLRALNLSRAAGLRSSGLELLMGACTWLERVDVSYCCGFKDREAAAISCAGGLKELRMDKCLGVSDVGLAKIAVGCGRLERLSLKWCMEISDLGIDLLCKKCLELKHLDVSYLKVTNESLRSIATLAKLETLVMVGCTLVNDVGLQFLEHGCHLLQEIDVSRCDYVTSSGLIPIIGGHSDLMQINAGYCISEPLPTLIHCMKALKKLKTIRIDGARVPDVVFHIFSRNCKSLTEIGFSKCIGVTNIGILQLVFGCANLRVLNLTCCHSITDIAISAVAESCRSLVCLKLEACNLITEKSLEQLGKFCSLLEELDLTDCCGVSDRGKLYLFLC
uniref:F-box/LRR-repeat protein 15-like leucin rich repeat domain-containing protein n=1 Tax=Rhizophora mucronata TaxID=61149 RepID=A0A2P2IT30_RHIMU